jgi:hypothetical protein
MLFWVEIRINPICSHQCIADGIGIAGISNINSTANCCVTLPIGVNLTIV